jgi:hypothetical protein
VIEMNIYYTAKDIEELAANGIQQLEVGPGVTLTDFARESAQQLGIDLVARGDQVSPPSPAATPPSNTTAFSSKYNKPTGCQHGSSSFPAAHSQASVPSDQSIKGADSNTVNRLIDLMGKVIKRGE